MHPIFNSSIAPHAHVNLHDSSTITTETETEARIKKVGGSDLLACWQVAKEHGSHGRDWKHLNRLNKKMKHWKVQVRFDSGVSLSAHSARCQSRDNFIRSCLTMCSCDMSCWQYRLQLFQHVEMMIWRHDGSICSIQLGSSENKIAPSTHSPGDYLRPRGKGVNWQIGHGDPSGKAAAAANMARACWSGLIQKYPNKIETLKDSLIQLKDGQMQLGDDSASIDLIH